MVFPVTPIDIETALFIGGQWVDAVLTEVRERDPVRISSGRANWSARTNTGKATFTLDNRSGRWSPDYTSSPHYGSYKRNIPARVGFAHGDPYLTYNGVSADVASTPDIPGAGGGGGAPTAPAFVDVTESEETSYTTTHTCDMPATIAADDRLLLIGTAGHESFTPKDQGAGVTDLDDWTLVASGNLYTPWNAWEMWEIGPLTTAEAAALAGGSVEFSTANSVRSSFQVIRTSGARAGGAGVAYDVAADTTSTPASASPNPPSLTTTWGADEHRWYAIALYGSGGESVSAYPTSYTSMADGHVTSLVQIASAHYTTSAATEDPAVFTLTGTENWMGVTFAYRAVEDTAADGPLDISGDIDLRIGFQLHEDPVDIDEGGSKVRICHKSSGADGIEWEYYAAGGALVSNFSWRDSSGTAKNQTSEATGAVIPLSLLHDRSALRVTLDVDNGASGHDVAYYTSTGIDGTWTQVGSTITTAGTTSIGTNDAPLRLGGSTGDATHVPFPGKIFAFQMLDGIDGTAVAAPDFTAQTVTKLLDGTATSHYRIGMPSFTDAADRVWTLGTGGRITDQRWRFHGELASLPVRWNVDGSDVWSKVEVSGLFRRLRQGDQRLESPLRRAMIRTATDVVQYWPLEEDGPTLTQFGAATGTAPFIVTGGYPTTATNTDFLASSPLPTPGDTVWTATVDDYTDNGVWQIRWLQSIPSTFTGEVYIIRIITSDMDWYISFRDNSGGQLQVEALRGLSSIYTSPWISFNITGTAKRMTFDVTQNGSTVDLHLAGQAEDEPTAGSWSATAAATGSAGVVTGIAVNPASDIDDWAIGHISLQNAKTLTSELATELNAHTGETAGDRIVRLGREEGIKTRIEGDPADTEPMGPQGAGSLIALLEECATTDLGILHEARSAIAVGYRTRTSMVSQDLKQLPDETALAAWWTTADVTATDQQTITDRSGVTGTATLGSTAAVDADDPTITLGSPTVIQGDGTSDYIQAPYTPTVTATTGELTIIVAGYWDADDTTDAYNRIFSAESAGNNGLHISTAAAATAYPRAAIGGASASTGQNPPGSPSLADGDQYAFAQIIDNGTQAAYLRGYGLSATDDITGIGTITWSSGRLMARAYSNTSNTHGGITDVVIFERALTETELDEVTDWMIYRHQMGRVALDYAAGEVAAPLEPDRDDQNFHNDIEVKNWTGTTAAAVLNDGTDMSISEPPVGAGRYSETFTVSASDSRLNDLAATFLNLSTVNEPRISRLAMALHHPALVADTDLAEAILEASLGDLVTVTNNLEVALGTTQVRQLIQGTRERLGNSTYDIAALTSPASPWDTTDTTTDIIDPAEDHSVSFRSQQTLATSGAPAHVLTALGHTSTTAIARSDLDGILDTWVAGTGGTTRNVTSAATWTTATAAAVPGDLVRVTTTFDPGGSATARGDLYGLSGSNLTAASGDGGDPGLPIIYTCADGVYIDDNDIASGVAGVELTNCRHVWAVGLNVRDSQFGIRCINWGGTAGYPAYVAYCTIENIGDAGLAAQGWWQLITSSGGTPPSGTGNTWGYSEHFVFEENTIDGVGVNSPVTGESIYCGRGSTPGWVSYCADAWVRGNTCNDWTGDGIEIKPGCLRVYVTDNDVHVGYATGAAPMSLTYVATALDLRPAFFDVDPQIWVEGNRVHDSDLTNTDGSAVHIMGYVGLSGIRIANNVFWAKPESATHPMWRARHEHGTNDTTALAAYRADPTWIVNNTMWGDDTFTNAGYGNPWVAVFPGTITFDLRNNICDQASPATGEVDASASDFIATVPAIGVAGDAEWGTDGHGSAFDLALTSTLIGAGEDISDLSFYIDRDISDREFDDKTAPNPGAYQPHEANL